MEYNINDLPTKIRKKLKILDEHWLWIGSATNKNRKDLKGKVSYKGKHYLAHRVIFHILTGFDLNNGLQVNHKTSCPISLCCNPACLYAGTQLDNARDAMELGTHPGAVKARQEVCSICGGEFTFSSVTGKRSCKVCRARRSKESDEREKIRLGIK